MVGTVQPTGRAPGGEAYGRKNYYGIGPDDYKQAEWLVARWGQTWRYDHTAKTWHRWTGVRWAPDKTRRINKAIADEVLERLGESPNPTPDEVKTLMKLYNIAPQEKALSALASFPEFSTDGSDWDQKPYLLGCENGIVDLRTNTLMRKPSPDTLVSRTTGRKFEPITDPSQFHERAPRFMEFMGQITSEDPTMVGFLLLWFGASMFGFSPEQRFLLMTGIGRNGKGAMKHAIMKAVGEYGGQPDGNVYMRSKMGGARSDGARADLIDLKGRRITFFSEPEGNRFNEEMLKAHTGGDLITARPLFSNNMISWEPTHSITFLVNNAPDVEDLGPSMSARVMVADFRERYDGEKEDKTLYRTLEKEADGILAILCWAAQAWYDSWNTTGVGITLPDRVVHQSKVFMERNDVVAAVLNEAMILDPEGRTRSSLLYEAYVQWHAREDRADDALTQTKFSQALERKGFRKVRTMDGMFFLGIRPMNAVQLAESEADDDEN